MQITSRVDILKLIGAQGSELPLKIARKTAASQPAPKICQPDVLKQAKLELGRLPEINSAKVKEIKTALAQGRLHFDADRLAQLIERYHGGSR